METLFPLDLPPGLFANGTKQQAAGRWYDGNGVRFRNGTIGPIGGFANLILGGAAILGVPSVAIAVPSTGIAPTTIVLGTTTHLYAIDLLTLTAYDITPGGGVGGCQLSLFGTYVLITTVGGGYFVWKGVFATPAAVTDGTYVDTGVFHTASALDTPSFASSIVTTPERFVFVLGGYNPTGVYGTTSTIPAVYSSRTIYWPSQETYFDFRPGEINSAGSFELTSEGVLMCGAAGRGETLLWTTADLWAATYIGAPLYYSFERKGNNCGIIAQNAKVVLDGVAYWMGLGGKFFRYDHGVQTIPCEVSDYLSSTMNTTLTKYIWAWANTAFDEITWFYGDNSANSSSPCNRYVTYNYVENHWTYGSMSMMTRVCGVSATGSGAGLYDARPLLIGPTGVVSIHEYLQAGRSGVFVSSGPMKIGAGDNVVRVQRIIPDDKTLGDVVASLAYALEPDATETTTSAITLTASTSVRFTGRQFRLILTEVNATNWRVGTVALGGILQGRR